MTLVIMAAGMGSRYGGLKQIDPVGTHGEFILDYSIYDAIAAGFRKVVLIIKEEHLRDFRDTIGRRPFRWNTSFRSSTPYRNRSPYRRGASSRGEPRTPCGQRHRRSTNHSP